MARKRANREGSIYRIPSGRWCAQVSVDGRRISKSFDTQKECLDWIHKMRGQIDDGMTYISSKLRLGEYTQHWLTSTQHSRRPSTHRHYEQMIRIYIVPKLGHIRVIELRPEHIQQFYNNLIASQVGTNTILKIHGVLHTALQQAVLLSMIRRNPVDLTHPPQKPVTEMAILNDSQVSQLLVTLKGHRWEALFQLAIVTGMRQMEILGLKWTDLDWVRQTIKVERQLVRPDRNGIQFAAPKTRYGKRSIALGERTIEALRAHFDRHQTERIFSGEKWQDHGLIFTNSLGGPIHPRNLLRDFKLLLQRAGLPAIRFHDLRHTAASLMLNNNIAPIVVSRRLGHSRASITLDIYGHLIPSMQAEAADKIDELVLPVPVQLVETKIN